MTNICTKALLCLEHEYPAVECTLNYVSDYELLIAARLAAQCTDERVNLVTKVLFKKFPSLRDFATANQTDIERIIKPCGLHKTKAKDIVNICKMLFLEYGSVLPSSMNELLRLPGVGRKTANLILGDIHKKPAVVVDTHCARITRRLGIHNSKNPLIIENILKKLLPAEKSNDFCHRLVIHGRKICKAIKPACESCCMKSFCVKNI